MNNRAGVLALLLGLASCSGATTVDPLAPVPTRVDPDEIATPRLREVWNVSTEDAEGSTEVPTHRAAVGADLIFIAYADRLDARDLRGDVLWQSRLGDPLAIAPIAWDNGVALATATQWLWIDSRGAPTAFLPTPEPPLDAQVFASGLLVVTSSSVQLLARHAAGLEVVWDTAVPGARRVAIAPDGATAYITGDDGAVHALSTSSGAQRWRSTAVEADALRAAVGDHVYVIGTDGLLYALRKNNGNKAWTGKDIGLRASGSPVVLDDLVWVPGLDAATHAFTTGGGSHQFRIPANGRVYLDLEAWGPWVISSPQYGPWLTLHGPRISNGPADPGAPRVVSITSTDDIRLRPGVGEAGVVLIDQAGEIRLLTLEQGVAAER